MRSDLTRTSQKNTQFEEFIGAFTLGHRSVSSFSILVGGTVD